MKLRVLSFEFRLCWGWFSIKFRYSQCSLFGGRVSQYRVCFFVAEDLPDPRGQNTVKGRLTQASKEKWRQALRGFCGRHVTERGRKRIALLRQARLTNKHHLQGWDNAWGSGTGLNITSFLATTPLGPPNSARRYKIPMSALTPELQSACPLWKCRSCWLLNDGITRLEFNWADPCRRVMMSFLDQGSKLVPHRRHNNYVDSIKQAGLSFCRRDWSVVSSAASAPFDKAGFFCRYAEAAKEFLDHNYCTNDLFLAVYPILSLDQNDGVLPDCFSSPEHIGCSTFLTMIMSISPTILANETDVVDIDGASGPVLGTKIQLPVVEKLALMMTLHRRRRRGLLSQAYCPAEPRGLTAWPQVIVTVEWLTISRKLNSRAVPPGKAKQSDRSSGRAMRWKASRASTVEIQKRLTALHSRPASASGLATTIDGGCLKWGLTSLVSTVNRWRSCFLMNKEKRATELRCPREGPLPKESADERLAGQTGARQLLENVAMTEVLLAHDSVLVKVSQGKRTDNLCTNFKKRSCQKVKFM